MLPNLDFNQVSYDCLKLSQPGSPIFWVLKLHFKSSKHHVLIWAGPWTLENIQRSLKSLKILISIYITHLMPPIKTLVRESDFLASIFSKTFFSLFKTRGQHLRTFFTKLKPLFS